MDGTESFLGRAYRVVYEGLSGRFPECRPWHFQWLDVRDLRRDLQRLLPTLGGKVLDVGCGRQPYRGWLGDVEHHVGVDIAPGPGVEVVVGADGRWPFPDDSFDVLLSSQVLEHVCRLEPVLCEMERVLKPGGVAVLSFPFLYPEHGAPMDFRRFTYWQAKQLLPGFEVSFLRRQGGIGSTLAILLLNWIENSMNRNFATRLLKAPLLPLWIPFCLVVNLLGVLFDHLDRTQAYYNNLLLVARKPATP